MSAKHTLLTLLATGALLTQTMAQVGVNNDDPEQALDVGGKLKIADDNTAPSDGTLRYNDGSDTFEGYADGAWAPLNTASGAPLTPIPVTGAVYTTLQGEGYVSMEYISSRGPNRVIFDANGGTSSARTVVPQGFTLVVDYIHIVGMSDTDDEQFLVEISDTRGDASSAQELSGGRDEPLVYISGSVKAGPARLGNGRAPLLIVDSGEQLTIRNLSAASHTGGIRMFFTGFLVRSLDDYFTY